MNAARITSLLCIIWLAFSCKSTAHATIHNYRQSQFEGMSPQFDNLADAKSDDSWGDGDTITLAPGAYQTGGLDLNLKWLEHTGTVVDASGTSLTLASDANTTTADYYVGAVVTITAGQGVGQSRTISAYDKDTQIATVSSVWNGNPNNSSTYILRRWFTLNCAGCTFMHATTNDAASAVFKISKSGVAVIGPLICKDTGSAGRIFLVGASTLSAGIDDFLIRDLTAAQCPINGSWSPMLLQQDEANDRTVSGTFERVKFNLGNGYRDVLATDGKISTGARGTIYVVDCELSGATYGNMINGGVSNNALSCDATADHYCHVAT